MKRILVIDDETFVREALKRVLEGSAVEVATAGDADAAFVELASQAFDLVITDVIMPRTDGVVLIRRLRSEYPEVRVIAVSGGGNFEVDGYRPDAISTHAYLSAASDAGADGVLAKPFETAELEELVRPLLDGRPSRRGGK